MNATTADAIDAWTAGSKSVVLSDDGRMLVTFGSPDETGRGTVGDGA
ncbi:MAG: hypothetical protein WD768_05160 [Phycisphaeraceae bacterium]